MNEKYHVMKGVNGRWKVIRSDSERATRTFPTQSEAIDFATDVSKEHRTELVIHGNDGRFVGKKSYAAKPERAG